MYTNLYCLLLALVTVVQCQNRNQLAEGSSCTQENGRNGTCVNMYRCRSVATYYVYKIAGMDSAFSNFPEPVICSRREDGEPVVCCPDCQLDTGESLKSKVVFVDGVKYEKKGPKAWTKCLEYFRELPYACHGQSSDQFSTNYNDKKKCEYLQQKSFGIGGYPAQRAQFPHMALLGYGASGASAQWLCGGAVLSERFVLTAAHCGSSAALGPVKFAGLGVLTRSELKDYWKIYKIKTIIKHPEYQSPMKYHDIALLETENEINFGKNLLPACLDVGVTQTKYAKATGWGRVGHRGELAEHLMVMELEEFNETVCSELFPTHRLLRRGYDVSTQSCYGRTDAVVDTCQGDSGGPLQTAVSDCVHFVFGLTSYGKDCGIPGNAGMYTRVSHYLPWIESIVWPDD